MEIEKCRIGMKVRLKEGDVATIDELYSNGAVRALDGIGVVVRRWASDLSPASDPCQELEAVRLKAFWEGRAAERKDSEEKISQIVANREAWKATAKQHCRNATYWREELTKLQEEALAERKSHINCAGDYDTKQLSEVAKIYVTSRIDASQMLAGIRKVQQKLLSDDARTVCELLEGSGPMTSREIASRLIIREMCVLENIIEARDAGRIRLVDGKYSIVRD